MTGGTASTARPLGFLMCTALVVGNTIGIGIFMLPASLAPYGLNALGAWLITAAGCLMVAWVFADSPAASPKTTARMLTRNGLSGTPSHS